jgi:hypothetical protein
MITRHRMVPAARLDVISISNRIQQGNKSMTMNHHMLRTVILPCTAPVKPSVIGGAMPVRCLLKMKQDLGRLHHNSI